MAEGPVQLGGLLRAGLPGGFGGGAEGAVLGAGVVGSPVVDGGGRGGGAWVMRTGCCWLLQVVELGRAGPAVLPSAGARVVEGGRGGSRAEGEIAGSC